MPALGLAVMADVAGEVTDLLQHLIRNECVNDGTPESGREVRSVDVLKSYLEGSGADLERYSTGPGRENLVARLEGSDPSAPSLLLLGHTDVVPASPDRWRHDPFGGELIDGEVWGRGAIDMLNITASMAVAVRRLASSGHGGVGFRPRGTLIYAAVADEESQGRFGAAHLLEHERSAVLADYVITESGGTPIDFGSGVRLPVLVGEKGTYWCRLRVRGTGGHASMPWGTDNAVLKAASVVQRLGSYQPPALISDTWRTFVARSGLPPELAARLVSGETVGAALGELPFGLAQEAHASTHTTFAPTIVSGGVKTNVIPDRAEIEVDIRMLPGQTAASVEAMLLDALGAELWADVEVVATDHGLPTSSPFDTPLWEVLERVSSRFYSGTPLVPQLCVGATDGRFFRAAGSVAYGYGLFSRRTSYDDYVRMFHGDDERVDVESLRLSTELWDAVGRDFLG